MDPVENEDSDIEEEEEIKKICKTCKKSLPLSSFHKGRRACKDCRKKVNHTFYANNKYKLWKNLKNPEHIEN